MNKPRLLDLFCGAGGAAMGYHRAGFDVVGVDIKPQKHYPFEFHQIDAMTLEPWWLQQFDAIHASPPCQHYSVMRHLPWLKDKEYWDSIPPTRKLLIAAGRPWVMENVTGAKLDANYLCGTMFGLPFFRHRLFETSFFWLAPTHPLHKEVMKLGRMFGNRAHETAARMQIDWMTREERSQAIPPAYTEFIGRELMKHISEVKPCGCGKVKNGG